jgi:hypothetical protein
MQREISDCTSSLKMLVDLAFLKQFLINVGPHEDIRAFLLPLFLTWKEPVERGRLRRKSFQFNGSINR